MASKEFEMFLKTSMHEYEGKYVAIVDDKVAASGENAKIVWTEAKKRFPDKTPTIAKIPKEETLILAIRWK